MDEQNNNPNNKNKQKSADGITVKNKGVFYKNNKNSPKPEKKPDRPQTSPAPPAPEKPKKKKTKQFSKNENKRAVEEYFNDMAEGAYIEADTEQNFDIDIDEEPAEPAAVMPEPAETGPLVEIVGIRYKPVGKIYFFAPEGAQYSINDKIMVETSRGLELGCVAIPNKHISASKVTQPLKQVLRKASEEDVEKAERNKVLAKETIKAANARIKFYKLHEMKMKLVEAEYSFDNSKLTYFFTAEGRVDFRELVKDLASIFKTRIEMRQIGIRDQTKILGGLSICGRQFCCNSFLQDFTQVTIKMAKEQNMQINSSKISGACGRLMCCLKYEHEAYNHLSKDTPKINSIVEATTGETGTVVESNILTGICKVKISQKAGADGQTVVIKPFPKKNLKITGSVKNAGNTAAAAEQPAKD